MTEDAGCDVRPITDWGHNSTEKLMERVTAGIMSDSGDDTTQADADAALTELAERLEAATKRADINTQMAEEHHRRAEAAERERDAHVEKVMENFARAERAEAQRDELVEALEKIQETLRIHGRGAEVIGARHVAYDALAKVRG